MSVTIVSRDVADLGGRNPFEQMPPPQEAEDGSHHGIGHDPCLMRQKRDQETGLDRGDGENRRLSTQMNALADVLLSRDQSVKPGKE